jgi:hypothetical protein
MEETFDDYLQRLKDRRTEDDYKYTDEDFEKYNDFIMDSWRCGMSVYKCLEFMYFAEIESKQKGDGVLSHLQWIHDRMVNVHNENENYDYMIKFRDIINQFKKK